MVAFSTGLRTRLRQIKLFTFHYWPMKFFIMMEALDRVEISWEHGEPAPGTPKAFLRNTWDKNPRCLNHGSLLLFLFFFLNGSIYEFEFEIHVAFVLNHQIFSSNKRFRNRTISNVCSMNQRWKTCFVFWIMHKLFQYFRHIFCQTLN